MHCDCHSSRLYSTHCTQVPIHNQSSIKTHQVHDWRKIKSHQKRNENVGMTELQKKMKESIYENSSIYFVNSIQKLEIEQIYDNPLWFYKNFIAQNRPCIILGMTDGWEVCDQWTNPQELIDCCKNEENKEKVSVSLTPDGFADSIVGQYFVEPIEIQASIKNVIQWKQTAQVNWKEQKNQHLKCQIIKESDNEIPANLIPYIQHQNSNLTEEQQLQHLHKQIPQDFYHHVSHHFFNDSPPDATNFWMGYDYSVSSLHKDPYQNFYTTIVGQKHFTLMPPISILSLPQEQFETGKWKLTHDGKLGIQLNEGIKTRWICANPDQQKDYSIFAELQQLVDWQMHVTIEKGETLYLPALWYHQVGQTHRKDPYTIAVNSWYDMSFTHAHTLYEAARKWRNYN